jgi:hypothetical protein
MPTDHLIDQLVEMLTLTRDAERDVFGALDPDVRDRPLREGDWSPKDHQAHLTAWKGRQADRFEAARTHSDLPEWQDEEDEINARLQAQRADWTWDALAEEADAVSERLLNEVRAADPELIRTGERLLDGTFGNGAFHAQQHFIWLLAADIGLDEARVMAFVDAIEHLIRTSDLPDRDRGTAIYNSACFHALAGRLDRARTLLREAFPLRSDLVDFAREDGDLVELRDEIDALAAQ